MVAVFFVVVFRGRLGRTAQDMYPALEIECSAEVGTRGTQPWDFRAEASQAPRQDKKEVNVTLARTTRRN